MITVHHLEQSRSMRILWLLEELQVPYTIKHYQRDPVTSLAPAELLKVHPLGKSPIIEDGDIMLPETGAIVEYLIGKYGKGEMRPAAGSKEETDYLHWMHFAEGTAMTPLLFMLVTGRIEEAKMPFFVRPVANGIVKRIRETMVDRNIPPQMDFAESALSGRAFFAGDSLSGADIMMSFPIEAAALRAGATTNRPNLARWLTSIHKRPAYLAALGKAGPYDFGPQT